jgi:hypothetical protein
MNGNTTHLSIQMLNVYGINALITRHKIANWVKKKTQTYVAYNRLISLKKNKHWLTVEE